MKAPSIEEQTGWRRLHPRGICRDFSVLERVLQTDFDASDAVFLRYAEARGVAYKAGVRDRFALTCDHTATKSDFLASPRWESLRWWVDRETEKPTRRQTPEELETSWRIIRAAKGALQDAWEIYQAEQTTAR